MAEAKTDNPAANVTATSAEKGPQQSQKATKKGASPGGYYWGTGRRKSAVARVRIKPGKGKLLINKKELSDYFPREQDRKAVLAPLKTVEGEKTFDVFVNVKGGGSSGQAGAVLLGIARALKIYDENYIQALRDSGHLTRDSRMVERKKPGQRGARRRFQFSKR
ncbi:MAG: 30S ribosomal protein S9 [Planctomycetota bacterium]|jgi:small subunit ribosomal protein S9